MYQYKGLEDTIAAVATATGQGGIGIVRLSGSDALKIAAGMFVSKKGRDVNSFSSHTVHYGWIKREGEIIDEVLLTVMKGPTSYTAEDVVEISCHGGMVAVKMILEFALESGARLAEPGEFTKRAFLNGRIDLTQAEAVLDIIQAKTDAFLRVSTHQLKGELSLELEAIRDQLMSIYTEIEAIVNFPEDEIDARGYDAILGRIEDQAGRIERLLETGEQGRIMKDGIRIVLCGKPNVGKSSLLNVLLKQPRAIVTAIAGTTRDVIEETAQIKGIPFQLVDTAGILEPRDLIEEEAIKRSHMSIEGADLVLLVLDASNELVAHDRMLIEKIKSRNTIVVLNKCDLPQKLDECELGTFFSADRRIKISVTKKTAIEALENCILQTVSHGGDFDTHGVLLSNVRHVTALKKAHEALAKAREMMVGKTSLEFVSEEIKFAVNQLDGITGRNIDQDLIDRIFSDFCIGK